MALAECSPFRCSFRASKPAAIQPSVPVTAVAAGIRRGVDVQTVLRHRLVPVPAQQIDGRVNDVRAPAGRVPVFARVGAHVEQTIAVETLVRLVGLGTGDTAGARPRPVHRGPAADVEEQLVQGRRRRRPSGQQTHAGQAVGHGAHVVAVRRRSRAPGLPAVFQETRRVARAIACTYNEACQNRSTPERRTRRTFQCSTRESINVYVLINNRSIIKKKKTLFFVKKKKNISLTNKYRTFKHKHNRQKQYKGRGIDSSTISNVGRRNYWSAFLEFSYF